MDGGGGAGTATAPITTFPSLIYKYSKRSIEYKSFV
jgi:hypothetical protein